MKVKFVDLLGKEVEVDGSTDKIVKKGCDCLNCQFKRLRNITEKEMVNYDEGEFHKWNDLADNLGSLSVFVRNKLRGENMGSNDNYFS